jgi:hypothetical protein
MAPSNPRVTAGTKQPGMICALVSHRCLNAVWSSRLVLLTFAIKMEKTDQQIQDEQILVLVKWWALVGQLQDPRI